MKLSTKHVVLCYRVTSGQRSSGQVQNCYLDHCGLNLQSVVASPFKNDFSHHTFCFSGIFFGNVYVLDNV